MMNNTSAPPRFVPTLTDVVQASVQYSHGNVVPQAENQLEDQIVHRVMQRVDLMLERRLREAVSQVILSHTQAMGPRLREEIELVVRESVMQAVAQELPHQRL
jgi:hypothetical protein